MKTNTMNNTAVNAPPIEFNKKTTIKINGIGTTDPVVAESTKVVTKEFDYWNNFYAKWDIGVPSQFCVLVATEADKTKPIVEFGCGNGRDSMYLARHGFKVFAGDLSEEAVHHNREKEEKDRNNANRAEFSLCDVASSKDVHGLVFKAREQAEGDGNLTLYNRFFLHSLDDEQECSFLTALSEATKTGDKLYMEFRCSLDAELDKLYKGHYRRYVETEKLVELLRSLEFAVLYQVTGQGMAKYKTEDPFVSRIIAEKL